MKRSGACLSRPAPRWLLGFLAAIVAVLAIVGLAATACATTTTTTTTAAATAETRVGAFNVDGEVLVGPPEHIPAGQRLGNKAAAPDIVVATGVAANGGRSAAQTCLKSFTGDTLVLMADGSKKPISDLEVGDQVIATDPETGQRVSRKITFVWVHQDQVLDLVVDGDTITTTEDHPFWSVTDQRFERADQLSADEIVLGDGGRLVTVSGLMRETERTAMAYNLSISGVHTYHVGDDAILVHNACGGLLPEAALDATGKVHGPLPRPGDLAEFDPDALVILRGELAGLLHGHVTSDRGAALKVGSAARIGDTSSTCLTNLLVVTMIASRPSRPRVCPGPSDSQLQPGWPVRASCSAGASPCAELVGGQP